METVGTQIAESRVGTDQSLDAERATTDVSLKEGSRDRRALDDLIERDRIRADERLWKSRQSADGVRARGRSSSASSTGLMDQERDAADQSTTAERTDADAILATEREHADAAIEVERKAQRSDHAELEARRQETNTQLIAERHRADRALAALGDSKASLMNAASERARERDVLAMVSHELRSPLSVIALNGQHIAECAQEASIREAGDDVTRAAARMERLLMDLLDVARIDSGTLGIVKSAHDPGAMVGEILRTYQPLFASRGMTFTAEGPADCLLVPLDHDRIVQVVSNLLGNAMKFTPAPGKVSLRVRPRGGEIEFVVRDEGPGIHPAELVHVFEKFWKLDSDTRRGLGLGLHICKSIVEGHGGRMWAESNFGHGAAFFFTLPTA